MPPIHVTPLDSLSLQDMHPDAELIPLLTPEDEAEMNREALPDALPLLPLRNTVLFPGVVIPISAGRDKSIQLLNEAANGDKIIGVVAQRHEDMEDPTLSDVYPIGTVAQILRVLRMPDGNITVILQGKKRFEVHGLVTDHPYLKVTTREIPDQRPEADDPEFSTIVDSIRELAVNIIKESPNLPTEATFAIKNIESDSFLINFVSSNMNLEVDEKQQLLSMNNLKDRALETLRLLHVEYQKLTLRNDIQSKVKFDLDQQQREYFLQQQMKTIQEELGGVSYEQEIEEMRQKGLQKKWSDAVGQHFEKELKKLQRTNPQSPDFGIMRNYLELFLELPWNEVSEDNFDLKRAQKILDRDHFGMDEVKKRIIEYLAVLKLRNDMKSPILCLTGPPGVGKTSIGRSVAEALGRQYVRISLGGLRDESEIRGHRKTYIGAMPGRIIQQLRKAGTSNPVFILDEIDKLSQGFQGDPSSALLEVLDPEQNTSFYDNFLELGYDLSKVLFIATSNNIAAVQPALRDRMEIIEVSGYTLEEKVEIARKHLWPKQLKQHGLEAYPLKLGKKEMERIIGNYTRESGVRNLEYKLGQLVRHLAKCIAMDEPYPEKLQGSDIDNILGPPRFFHDKYESNEVAGVVTGLAWTSVGGEILFIESSLSKGKGQLTLTGNLGQVMKESATLAMEYIKAQAEVLGLDPLWFEQYNVHLHVPEGATPKDGPSAGIAMLTALFSVFTQRKVRSKWAMTGEITLRGKVLPVGGIKEKILAAKRANITDIILCEANRRDVEIIPADYLKGLHFHYVTDMRQVLDLAVMQEQVKKPKTLVLKKD